MPDIFYFSPTGTGQAIAKKLCLGLSNNKCLDLTPIENRENPVTVAADCLLTLIYPVYAHGVPTPVRQWIATLPERRGPVCLICTFGSVSAGHAIEEAANLFQKKGGYVVAAAEIPGPHAYDCAQTRFDLKRGAETDFKSVVHFYQAALQKVEEGGGSITLVHRRNVASLIPQELLARLATCYPSVNASKCHNCKQCNAVCPVCAAENSDVCIRCAACVRVCPSGARKLWFRLPIPSIYLRLLMKKRPPRFIL